MPLNLDFKKSDGATITTASGEAIRFVVLEATGSNARISFEADRSIQIVRDNAVNKEPNAETQHLLNLESA